MSSNAHRPCSTCHGMGFLATGQLTDPDRSYARCKSCDGSGQVYLDPASPKSAGASADLRGDAFSV